MEIVSIALIMLMCILVFFLAKLLFREYRFKIKIKQDNEALIAKNKLKKSESEIKKIDTFLTKDYNFDELKEIQNEVQKVQKKLQSSDPNYEIEVDYVVASQILKNWDKKVLVSEDGKIVFSKEKYEKQNAEIEYQFISNHKNIFNYDNIKQDNSIATKENNDVPELDELIEDETQELSKIDKVLSADSFLEILITDKLNSENEINFLINDIVIYISEYEHYSSVFVDINNDNKIYIRFKSFFQSLVMLNLIEISEATKNKLLCMSSEISQDKIDFIQYLNSVIGDVFEVKIFKKDKVHIAKKYYVIFEEDKKCSSIKSNNVSENFDLIDYLLVMNISNNIFNLQKPKYIYNNKGLYDTFYFNKNKKDDSKPF